MAIAVAIVPPLAAFGLLLEDGRPLFAQGAFLLFAANLVGITLAVAVVMLMSGYAPRPRLPRRPTAIAATHPDQPNQDRSSTLDALLKK